MVPAVRHLMMFHPFPPWLLLLFFAFSTASSVVAVQSTITCVKKKLSKPLLRSNAALSVCNAAAAVYWLYRLTHPLI